VDRPPCGPSLTAYLRGSLRWAWLVALICVIVTASAYRAARAQTPVYSASAVLVYEPRLAVENPLGAGGTGVSAAQETLTMADVAAMVQSPQVSRHAVSMLAARALSVAGYRVSAAPFFPDNGSMSNTLEVTAVSSDAAAAARAANAYSAALILVRSRARRVQVLSAERVVRAELDRASQSVVESLVLTHQLRDLQILGAVSTSELRIVKPAAMPVRPDKPRPLHTALLALVISLIAGAGFVLALQEFDVSVRDAREAAQALSLPLLGRIPDRRATGVARMRVRGGQVSDGERDAYLTARLNLERVRLAGEPPARVILIAAAQEDARSGAAVTGLAAALPASEGRTAVVCAGNQSSRPGELVDLPGFRRLCDEARRHADIVLVDSPAIGSAGDAAAFAACADAAIVVIDLRRISQSLLPGLRQALASFPCRMLGLIVVGDTTARRAHDAGARHSAATAATRLAPGLGKVS
jgi:hypothetical protein